MSDLIYNAIMFSIGFIIGIFECAILSGCPKTSTKTDINEITSVRNLMLLQDKLLRTASNENISGYLWYSEKQNNFLNSYYPEKKIFGMLYNNNKIVQYTEMTRENKPSGNWDDYKLLGYGRWVHNENY